MNSVTKSRRVLWQQVCGLAAVQGAIALTWVIYNLYLVELLTQQGFSKPLATTLLILENVLGALMEPLMGSLSDRTQHWVGSRFPQVALGMILAATIFISIPVFAIGGGVALRQMLPVALVAWALAMTVFRSPALSLLGRYAFASDLPQAAAVLTLVGGVAGAMAPLANQFILGLGAKTTFAIGSGILLIAALVLRQINPNRSLASETGAPAPAKAPLSGINLSLVFGVGFTTALGFRLVFQMVPSLLKVQIQPPTVTLIMGLIFIALAASALPCGALAVKIGNRRAMAIGLASLVITCGLILGVQNTGQAVVLAIALGVGLSLLSNGTLPYALSMVPPAKGGLGTGTYFSGGAVAFSLLGSAAQREWLSPSSGMLLGMASFAIAALLLFMRPRV
ncbi:MAG: MFS transporter [Cyanobacteria bacterium P01_A01_bin.114]